MNKTYHSNLKYLLFIAGLMLALLSFGQGAYNPTKETVYYECWKRGVKNLDIVTAQSVLETGHYRCANCSMDKNNIFGFFYRGSYLKYDHWTDSIAYYKRWQDKYYSEGDYYAFLTRIGYAQDQNYITKLKSIAEAEKLIE